MYPRRLPFIACNAGVFCDAQVISTDASLFHASNRVIKQIKDRGLVNVDKCTTLVAACAINYPSKAVVNAQENLSLQRVSAASAILLE
jgi:hypothetical protein